MTMIAVKDEIFRKNKETNSSMKVKVAVKEKKFARIFTPERVNGLLSCRYNVHLRKYKQTLALVNLQRASAIPLQSTWLPPFHYLSYCCDCASALFGSATCRSVLQLYLSQ